MFKISFYTLSVFFLVLTFSCKPKERKQPSGVISLVPSLTEFSRLVYPNRVIGISNLCSNIGLSDSVARVGDYRGLDYEQIINLNPERVLMLDGLSSLEQVKKLIELGIEIQFFNDNTIEEVLNIPIAMDSIKGKHVSDSLFQVLDELKAMKLTEPISYLILISDDPIQVYGNENYLSDFLESLGYVNAAASFEHAYPILDNEYLLANKPHIIVTSNASQTKQFLNRKFPPNTFDNVLFVEINEDILSRSGPNFLKVGVTMNEKWYEYIEMKKESL